MPSKPKGVLLLPADVQFVGPARSLRMRRPQIAKFCCRARLCRSLFWRGLLSPIFSASALFGFLVQVAALFLVFLFLSEKEATERSTMTVVGGGAFCAALVLWIVIQALVSPLRVRSAERAKGKWTGARFIYNEPLRVLTTEWTPGRNGLSEEFVVEDAPPYALVDYSIKISGPSDRLRCLVTGSYSLTRIQSVLELWRPALFGRAVLNKGRRLQLHCHSLPNTIPALVYVSVLGWEMDPHIGMDYTDLRTNARLVFSPRSNASPDSEVVG